MFLNIVISVYVAIFLTPVILDIIPEAGDVPCSNALALAVLGVGTFFVLYGITWVFLTGQFTVSFPKSFDVLLAGILGFLAGFLVLSFAAFVITITPISQNRFVRQVGLNRNPQQAHISYICFWCDLVNSVVSSPDTKITSKQAVEQLLSETQSKTLEKEAGQTSTSTPVEPGDSNVEHQPDRP
jgi:uncharacterized membrane protein required for colicin V production